MNKGLEFTQNKDKRMAFENALKSYSATISGCGGKDDLMRNVFGEDEFEELIELGFTKFCYKKTEELYERYPFPKDEPIAQLPIKKVPFGDHDKVTLR